MADDQLKISSAPLSCAFSPGLDSQTSQLLQSEQQKVNEAAFKLDKLSEELESMWSSQGSPTSQEAVQPPAKDVPVTGANPFGVSTSNKLGTQSQPGPNMGVMRSSSKQPSQIYAPLTGDRVSSPYSYDPLILPKQDQRSQSNRAPSPQPMLGPQTQYSKSDWRSQLNRAPSPQSMLGPQTQYSNSDWRSQSDRAPSSQPMLGPQTQYPKSEWRSQSDRAPSSQPMLGPQTQYSNSDWRSQSDRAPSSQPMLGPQTQYSNSDWRSQSDRAPSSQPMLGPQTQYSNSDWRSQSDRAPSSQPMLGPQTQYSNSDWRSQSDRAPSSQPMLGPQTQYSNSDWRSQSDRAPSSQPVLEPQTQYPKSDWRSQSDRAPSSQPMLEPQTQYSKSDWRSQSDRCPSPRLMLGPQTQYSQLDWQSLSDRALSPRGFNPIDPYSQPECRSQSDLGPSPRPNLGPQTQYSQLDWQSQSDRAPSPRGFNTIDPYSQPECRSQPDRASSPRGFNPIDPYSQPESRSQPDRASSPRGFNPTPLEKPVCPSYHGQFPVCEPQSFSSSGVDRVTGIFSPSLSAFSGPTCSPELVHGFSPRENVPSPYCAASLAPERGRLNFDMEEARTKPEFNPAVGAFATDPGKGDNLKPMKPASVWAEADLDIAYEKKPSKTPTQENKWDSNWNTTKQGGTWRQTDLDLAVPGPSKVTKGRTNVNTIQLYGTLPKDGQVLSVSPWWLQATLSKQRKPNQSWSSSPVPGQPTGLFSVAPGSPRSSAIKERRNVLPLSVIIRPTIVSNWGQEVAPDRLRMRPPVASDPRSPAQPQQGQEVASPLETSEVEQEIARILPAGEGECGEGAPPRPLSPTRLQPMLLPGAEGVGNKEELLKIRATIPRALKKRSSIDQPLEERLPLEHHTHQYQQLTRIFRRRSQKKQQEGADETPHTLPTMPEEASNITITSTSTPAAAPVKRTILKKEGRASGSKKMRARLSPLVVLLDAALLGELNVVKRIVHEIDDASQSNDEGITPLHNAVCGGHYDVVEFLVNFGVNVNVSDSHGWTPLHCAASCNDLSICSLLVRKGAAIFSMTLNDGATATDKCDAYLDGYEECYGFLSSAEQQAGMLNSAVLYALWDYEAENADELSFREGEAITILQRGNKDETYWWWASLYGREGYVPYNLLGLFPRVRPTA